jgi:Arc/MetJ-type ribon-helix-helix transcriptional regulator
MKTMRQLTVTLPACLLEYIDERISAGDVQSRDEFVRGSILNWMAHDNDLPPNETPEFEEWVKTRLEKLDNSPLSSSPAEELQTSSECDPADDPEEEYVTLNVSLPPELLAVVRGRSHNFEFKDESDFIEGVVFDILLPPSRLEEMKARLASQLETVC